MLLGNVDVPYLNVWGNPLPIAAVLENANTTNVTSLQSVWLIEYHGSLYYLIKGNRKIIFKKNCNNPAFCPKYLAPAGVECSWNEHSNFIWFSACSESLHACGSHVPRIKYLIYMMCSWHSIKRTETREVLMFFTKTSRDGAPYQVVTWKNQPLEKV